MLNVLRWTAFGLVPAAVALFLNTCGVPNLESEPCSEARIEVKRFYSLHFANDMGLSPESLKLREPFLTQDLTRRLREIGTTNFDPFTLSNDHPRTFKIAKCRSLGEPARLEFQVQIYWRDDQSTIQKEVRVATVKASDTSTNRWLIDSVTN